MSQQKPKDHRLSLVKIEQIQRLTRWNTQFKSTCICLILTPMPLYAATWEQQADRLQNIGAAYLDSPPVPRPNSEGWTLGTDCDFNFLPKVNPKVGEKFVQFPNPKYHVIPTITAGGLRSLSPKYLIGGRAYMGDAPTFLSPAFGIKSKLSHFQMGAQLEGSVQISSQFSTYIQSGYHFSNAEIKGQIASSSKPDTFSARTSYLWTSLGINYRPWGFWIAQFISIKRTTSIFFIGDDETSLTLTDNLQDSSLPFASESSIGWNTPWGIKAALSYLIVPNRAIIPRFSIGYHKQMNVQISSKSKSKKQKITPKIAPKKNQKLEKKEDFLAPFNDPGSSNPKTDKSLPSSKPDTTQPQSKPDYTPPPGIDDFQSLDNSFTDVPEGIPPPESQEFR